MLKATTSSFISKAKAVHADRYLYDLVDYVGSHIPVIIVCSRHGEFQQRPSNHLSGAGCIKCQHELNADTKRGNIQNFIDRSRSIHGDRYDYSRVEYTNSYSKVIIVCPTHGEFHQIPSSHLDGVGCRKCGTNRQKSIITKPQQSFVEQAIKVHAGRYDYTNTVYTKALDKITIRCPKHGEFQQEASSHLKGMGCYECGLIAISVSNTTPQADFIDQCQAIHGDRYDYSNVIYTHSHDKVSIKCAKHGKFLQSPFTHLRGCGCSKCSRSISKSSQRWLDSLGLPNDAYHREVKRLIPDRRYTVDGYDPATNTVYEFHGDYWHGNPARYASTDRNVLNGISFGELYRRTIARKAEFETAGYRVVEIWESDWASIDVTLRNIG